MGRFATYLLEKEMVKEPFWSEGKWKVFIYDNPNTKQKSVGVENDFYSDWPIQYANTGRVSYDHPERIPANVKKQVWKAFMKIKPSVETEAKEYNIVKDIPDSYQFISNDSDVKAINDMYDTDYGSFFVIVGEGDYDSVYGLDGTIPELDEEVHKVK